MPFPMTMKKFQCSSRSLPAALLVALIAGCGSDADSPETKRQKQENATAIREDEAADKIPAKSAGGKKDAVVKSIKGRLGGE